jgi:hypothetical protein
MVAAVMAPLLLAMTVAMAEPVTVVTRSTGTTYADPGALHALAPGNDIPYASPLAYELTLSSTFDWSGPLPEREEWASQVDSDTRIDFRVGDLHWQYAGTASGNAVLYTPFSSGGDGYQHEIWLDPSEDTHGYLMKFEHFLIAPTGSLGPGGPLTQAVIDGASMQARFVFTAYRINEEFSTAYRMGDDAGTFTLMVLSPVPEPAACGLLATGLLVLSIRARRNKGTPVRRQRAGRASV